MCPIEEKSDFLRVEEVARRLGVNIRTVYRQIQKGELPAVKFGGQYFISRSELEARLNPTGEQRHQPLYEPETAFPVKCGSCLRLLRSLSQVSGRCAVAGCSKLICTNCAEENIHFCREHQPSRAATLEEVRLKHETGEVTLLVTAPTARLREVNFLSRLQVRISRINSLIHPLSGELITISNGGPQITQKDERADVLRLMGRVVLDNDAASKIPLNASLEIRLPNSKNQKGAPVLFDIAVKSRLPEMIRDGFDTNPMTCSELTDWLLEASQIGEQSHVFRFVVLASPTGWDSSSCELIQGNTGERRAPAYAHPMALFYLFDLETSDLIYNLKDENAVRYAELFSPLLPSEEGEEIVRTLTARLEQLSSITLDEAARQMPYSRQSIMKAFESMVQTGHASVVDMPDLGMTLVRR